VTRASTSWARSYTNTIEGFWSIFSATWVGTFHKVSAKYRSLYVAEFQFRYNNRDNADIFGEAIREC
jgi:ISXO2-like transposase domain